MAAAPATHSAGADGGGQAAAAEEESLELLVLSAPLPPSLLWLTWPVVAGFSFDAKAWGVVMVAGLRPVTFNEEAFARLVLPPARKELIKALVRSHGGGGLDIIAGKGEGTIFLLHGPPGCGKTLTAEAIAELLHRPLYVVSMGELGTTPEALEERLTDVLEVCTPWGALVLIDEAEMLLERRSKDDLVRNAMVCVMLRLLEYYTGILFLTTNRVESLDPAFQSRVQCALRYEPLDAASRAQIWGDLLGRLTLERADDVDVGALAARQLNGRQIKNTLQLAVALAANEQAPLAQRHLEATLDITTAFVEHASAAAE
jgi:SpoVK/Ycf46/Vps4 family AAA+-type ATPase